MAKAKGASTSSKKPASAAVSGVPTASSDPQPSVITTEERYRMIAEAAYFRAEARGFRGGDPVADWLEAEAEIDRLLLPQPDEYATAHRSGPENFSPVQQQKPSVQGANRPRP
jgi:hypothetical protein